MHFLTAFEPDYNRGIPNYSDFFPGSDRTQQVNYLQGGCVPSEESQRNTVLHLFLLRQEGCSVN